jgi:hypothetical protein
VSPSVASQLVSPPPAPGVGAKVPQVVVSVSDIAEPSDEEIVVAASDPEAEAVPLLASEAPVIAVGVIVELVVVPFCALTNANKTLMLMQIEIILFVFGFFLSSSLLQTRTMLLVASHSDQFHCHLSFVICICHLSKVHLSLSLI